MSDFMQSLLSWNTLLAAGLGIFIGWLLIRNKNVDTSKIRVISKKDFKANMRKGQLIDIRKKEDFEQGKIKGARNFKVRNITGKYAKIRKDQGVYLYCKNGMKSKRVAKKLVKDGVNDVYILEGGFDKY